MRLLGLNLYPHMQQCILGQKTIQHLIGTCTHLDSGALALDFFFGAVSTPELGRDAGRLITRPGV